MAQKPACFFGVLCLPARDSFALSVEAPTGVKTLGFSLASGRGHRLSEVEGRRFRIWFTRLAEDETDSLRDGSMPSIAPAPESPTEKRGSPTTVAVRLGRLSAIVERSTTGADPMQGVQTGWTEPHFTGSARPRQTKTLALPRSGSRVRIPSPAPTAVPDRGGSTTHELSSRWAECRTHEFAAHAISIPWSRLCLRIDGNLGNFLRVSGRDHLRSRCET